MIIEELEKDIEECLFDIDYHTFEFLDTDIILLDTSSDEVMFQITKAELDDLMKCFSNLDEYGELSDEYEKLYIQLCTVWRSRGLSPTVGIMSAIVIRDTTQFMLDF